MLDRRFRGIVNIACNRFGFQPHKGTIDAIFIFRQLQEKILEKARDRVPREVVYWCMRKRGVPEKYVRLVKATCANSTTRVRMMLENTGEFEIKVGLHQGSALSPFLCILVLDTLTNHIKTGTPCEIIFADDIAIAGRT